MTEQYPYPNDPRDLEPAPNPYTPNPSDDTLVEEDVVEEPVPKAIQYNYFIETTETRTWYGKLRFNWRVVARNGETILASNQGHSNRQDRDDVIANFLQGSIDPIPRAEGLYNASKYF